MVRFITFLQSTQNRDGILNGGFQHLNGLESAFEGGIFLNVLAVFVKRRSTDAAQFAACECRLQHIRRVNRSLRRTCPNDGVELVNKEDDLSLGLFNIGEDCLEPVFKFAAIFTPGDERA